MDVTLSIIAIAVLIALFVFIRRRPKTDNVRPYERERRSSDGGSSAKFHAVSIHYAPEACAAAKRMDGRRFLSSAAPRIPLPDCDAPECRCKFSHHKDRRSGEDRRNPYTQGFGGASTGKYLKEQRKSGERRRDS